MILDACLKLAHQAIAAAPRDGITRAGPLLIARRGPLVVAWAEAYDWLLATIPLWGEDGFVDAVLNPSAQISGMARAVVVMRLDSEGAELLRYYATNRKATELAATKVRRRVTIGVDDAVKLATAYGSKRAARPGRSLNGGQSHASA